MDYIHLMAFLLCVCSVMVLRAGLALFEAGLSRSKNAASAVMWVLCDLGVATLAFWAFGAAILMQNSNGYLGIRCDLIASSDIGILSYLCLAVLGSGIVSGMLAERARFTVVAPLSLLMAAVLIPVVGHWVWFGFLARLGVLDVGGALPLHLAAATVGLVGAWMIGPRHGKYNKDGSANGIPGHSIPLMGAGVLIMLPAWAGYLVLASVMRAPETMPQAVLNALLASAAGVVASMVYGAVRYGKPEVFLALLGLIGGMVSVSAGAGTVPAWAAVLLGVAAGVAVPWVAIAFDLHLHIDDPSGAGASFGAGSIISLIGAAILRDGSFAERFRTLGANLFGIVVTVVLSATLAWGLFTVLRRYTKIRSTEADEYDGLDLAEHDINAYPDFQQTMIKSYHLREA